MTSYFRFIAYSLRAVLVLWWVAAILIPFTWYAAGEPFPPYWWTFHLFGAAGTAALWFASSLVLRFAGEK